MALQRRLTLGGLGAIDPGGMALPADQIDPGGRAIPAGPIDPGGMALPAGSQGMAQSPGDQWMHPQVPQGANPNAPTLQNVNGQWTLLEHGNQRPLQPDEVAAAQGYVTNFWNQFAPFGGNVWGSGHDNDPYMGKIPFPEGRGPDFGEKPPGGTMPDGTPWFNPQYGHMSSGGLFPGAMQGAIGAGMPGPMRGAIGLGIGAAMPGIHRWFGGGGRSGGGAVVNRFRNGGTVGDLGSSQSSYDLVR